MGVPYQRTNVSVTECSAQCTKEEFCIGYEYVSTMSSCTIFIGGDYYDYNYDFDGHERKLMPPMLDMICIGSHGLASDDVNGISCSDVAAKQIDDEKCDESCQNNSSCIGFWSSVANESCTQYYTNANSIESKIQICHRSNVFPLPTSPDVIINESKDIIDVQLPSNSPASNEAKCQPENFNCPFQCDVNDLLASQKLDTATSSKFRLVFHDIDPISNSTTYTTIRLKKNGKGRLKYEINEVKNEIESLEIFNTCKRFIYKILRQEKKKELNSSN